MKIDNSLKSIGFVQTSESRSDKGTAATKGDAASVSVELSALSAELIKARPGAGEVVDAARVAEIKQAIAEGRFKINPEVVADRLLATVQELIRAYK